MRYPDQGLPVLLSLLGQWPVADAERTVLEQKQCAVTLPLVYTRCFQKTTGQVLRILCLLVFLFC